MLFELTEESRRLEKIFKDYHEAFNPSGKSLKYHYEIYMNSGIGMNVYIVCDTHRDKKDITDYSTW